PHGNLPQAETTVVGGVEATAGEIIHHSVGRGRKARSAIGGENETVDRRRPHVQNELTFRAPGLCSLRACVRYTSIMTTTIVNGQPVEVVEPDFQEVEEWLEAFDQVVEEEGPSGAARLLDALTQRARKSGVDVPVQLNTPYVNTIPVEEESPYPGDRGLERRIKSLIRWNAMAMVHRQNKKDPGIGGQSSTESACGAPS